MLWNLAEQLGRRGIQVAVTLLLAYFLSPEDYGLVAMMAVFLALGTSLMDSGFTQALIRLKDAKHVDFDTAFYANVVLGILSYLILFVTAPYIADFYNEQRLIELIRVAALTIVINAFQVVQIAQLSRELNFKAQLKANLPAALISGIIALVLAYFDFGVWALIWQMLLSALLMTVFLWLQHIWRPTFTFCRESLYHMYNFGYKLFLSGLLDIVFRNLYVIIIAKYFTTGIAGLYFFADKIRELIVLQLVFSIQSVTYPALATMQDDNIRLKENYKKIVKIMTFIMFPLTLFLAALSDILFQTFLPQKWWEASSYLSIMLIAWLLIPMHAINVNVLQVKGRSDHFLILEFIKKAIAAIVLSISIVYGIYGLLIGQIIGGILAYIPNVYFANRLIGYSLKEQIGDFMPVLLLSGGIALFIYFVQMILQWNKVVELIVLGVAAFVFYIVIAQIMKLQAYVLTKDLLFKKLKG